VSDARVSRGLGDVAGRGEEEVHHVVVREGRRVGHVDNGVRALQHLLEALAGDGIHSGARRSGHGLVAVFDQPVNHVVADQAGATDDNDLHGRFLQVDGSVFTSY